LQVPALGGIGVASALQCTIFIVYDIQLKIIRISFSGTTF